MSWFWSTELNHHTRVPSLLEHTPPSVSLLGETPGLRAQRFCMKSNPRTKRQRHSGTTQRVECRDVPEIYLFCSRRWETPISVQANCWDSSGAIVEIAQMFETCRNLQCA
ncbi:hypothetical protein J6590_026010 [Homalodisca vitripennis]|nr:hypothetical protein J6590_026010 [Homalodisca vitripennis]